MADAHDEVIQELSGLLERERAAAVAADVATLESLVEPKRRLVCALVDGGAAGSAVDDLVRQSRANLELMRNLVGCLRSLARPVEGEPTYGRRGHLADVPAAQTLARI